MTERRRIKKAILVEFSKSGLSQAAYAKRIGVTQGTLSAYLRGVAAPMSDVLLRIADESEDPVRFFKQLAGERSETEWPEPCDMEASIEAVQPFCKSVWRSIGQLKSAHPENPLKAYQSMESAFAAIYLLAYEAGRVAGACGERRDA